MRALRVSLALVAAAGILAVAYLVATRDSGPFFPGGALPEASPAETGFALEQNQPNPFQQSTAIVYRIPEEDRVTLRVYNTLGAPVITLVDYLQGPGFHEVEWDGRDVSGNRLPGGVYFYQLSVGGRQELRRMVLLP